MQSDFYILPPELFDLRVESLDQGQLKLVQSRKRPLRLTRTHYEIKLLKGFHFSMKSCEWHLPGYGKTAIYHLLLLPVMHSKTRKQAHAYFLKAIAGGPFKVNNQYSFFSPLLKEQRFSLGLHTIKFEMESSKRLKINDHKIPEEIIMSQLNILIQGETGTGKSVLAKTVHLQSGKSGPFVHLNLNSFSPQLIESELFGHRKGAFTGAHNDKKGALARSDGGTLFLDEIDSLPLYLQTKLLLFFDHNEFTPVGGEISKKVKTRIIIASGRNLQQLVDRGEMRRDLYFRLTSGFTIDLHPLRVDRSLLLKCLDYYSRKYQIRLSSRLRRYYLKCDWPGNIRQLEGHIQKKKVLSGSHHLDIDELELLLEKGNHRLAKYNKNYLSLDDYKKKYCREVYYSTGGSVTASIKILNISRQTLRRYLQGELAC